MTTADLISPGHLAEQQRLHADPRGYGGKGSRWVALVAHIARSYACRSILDYGCGQGTLATALGRYGVPIAEYDPAIPGKSERPKPADLVVCTDVLEHVEPDRIDAVLADLAGLTERAALLVVSLVPTSKTLSDGRSAHILIRSRAWWTAAVQEYGFTVAAEPSVRPDKQWVAILARANGHD